MRAVMIQGTGANVGISLGSVPDGMRVVCLSRYCIAKCVDADPLAQRLGLRQTMLQSGKALPGEADREDPR